MYDLFGSKKQTKCMICNKVIDYDEDYVHLMDYRKGKLSREGYHHNICWYDKIKEAKDLKLQKVKKTDEALEIFGGENSI